MNKARERNSLFCGLLFLAACASQPDEPSPASSTTLIPQPVDMGRQERLAGAAQEKAKLTAAFYTGIPKCKSGPFSLRDLMVDEMQLSDTDVTPVVSTLNVMGYPVDSNYESSNIRENIL